MGSIRRPLGIVILFDNGYRNREDRTMDQPFSIILFMYLLTVFGIVLLFLFCRLVIRYNLIRVVKRARFSGVQLAPSVSH